MQTVTVCSGGAAAPAAVIRKNGYRKKGGTHMDLVGKRAVKNLFARLLLLSLLLGLIVLAQGCSQKSDLKKVKLNEVAHSIFYAPMYVALEEG